MISQSRSGGGSKKGGWTRPHTRPFLPYGYRGEGCRILRSRLALHANHSPRTHSRVSLVSTRHGPDGSREHRAERAGHPARRPHHARPSLPPPRGGVAITTNRRRSTWRTHRTTRRRAQHGPSPVLPRDLTRMTRRVTTASRVQRGQLSSPRHSYLGSLCPRYRWLLSPQPGETRDCLNPPPPLASAARSRRRELITSVDA